MPQQNGFTNQIEETDVAIIGAGPVGLFAVFECGMLGLSCHVVDTLEDVGGQCGALYPEKPIYDIPGYPSISAAELIEKLEEQAYPFRPVYHLNQQVVSINKQSSKWHLSTSKGKTLSAKAIIIAGGAGAFGPNKPPLEDIESYEGHSVFYMVRRKGDFEGKDIVIAGGGDSAVDWALSLASIAKSVRLVHRRDKFRAAPESIRQLETLSKENKVEIITPYQLKSLQGEGQTLTAVDIVGTDGSVRTLMADILLPFFGLAMNLGPIGTWGLALDNNHIKVDATTCQTNIGGIYAIGDIATYSNKTKLILTGFSEAAFAAHDIYKLVHPDKPLHFEYSTTKGLPDEGKGDRL